MRQGLVAFLIGVLAACSPVGVRSGDGAKSIARNSGNGDSYSGKTYKSFVHKDPQGACPADIEAEILYSQDGEILLSRENCRVLTPALPLSPADVELDFNSGKLIYGQDTFVADYNPSCSYPEYPGPIADGAGSCMPTSFMPATTSSNAVNSGGRYEFAIYNVSSLTSSYSGERYITYQRLDISKRLPNNSIDIIVSSYEPVRWEFTGNVAAIRSVHIRGYHCATFTGVDSAKVSISTYEQGDSPNVLSLPLSLNLALQQTSYEGTCSANRTFLVE